MGSLRTLFLGLGLLFCCSGSYAGQPKHVSQLIKHSNWNFTENKGQLECASASTIKYYGRQGWAYLYCQPGRIGFVFAKAERSDTVENISEASGERITLFQKGAFGSLKHKKITTNRADMVFLGSNPYAEINATDQQDYYENYYTGSNADSGIVNVHTYKTITYHEIYPHIDLVLHAVPNGMKYEFVVHPGGKVSDIQIQWNGLRNLKMNAEGGIFYGLGLGNLSETAPVSYSCAVVAGLVPALDNAPACIPSRFVIKNRRIQFNVGKYDKTKDLVIDPMLVWGTYFGGGGSGGAGDFGYAMAIDGANNVIITGLTYSTSKIATQGAYQTAHSQNQDAYIAKFNSAGKILWATYFGGPGDDVGSGVGTNKNGDIYIAGSTSSSSGIATSGAFQTSYKGNNDAFLAKFNTAGQIQWSTYFGGSNDDFGQALTLDLNGNPYIAGWTQSTSGIATSGAYQTSYISGSSGTPEGDAYLAKFNANGSLQWATYWGNGQVNATTGIATDAKGNLAITGVEGPVFLAKFTESGGFLWRTDFGAMETASSVCFDGLGNIYLAYGNSDPADMYAVLQKYSASGSLQWATTLGSGAWDRGTGITCDSLNYIYMAGYTESLSRIATAGAYQTKNGGNYDAFLAKFNTNGKIQWSTYYGGFDDEFCYAIAVDHSNNAYICGMTQSASGIATKGAYQTSLAGNDNAFLAKFGPAANDAGLAPVPNVPSTVCADTSPVKVQLYNYGTRELDSVTINWSLNDTMQASYYWKGKIPPDSSATVTIGKHYFGVGVAMLKAWTSSPNGQIDSVPENDTMLVPLATVPLPQAFTGPNQIICQNSSVVIGGPQAGNDSFSWVSKPAGFSSNSSNPTVSPQKTTVYYLTEVQKQQGCSKTDSVVVKVNPLPAALAGPAKAICIGDSTSIGDTASTGFVYGWTSSPPGFFSLAPNPVVKPNNTTDYTLTETNTATGCVNSNSVLVTVNPLPQANVGQSSYQICTGTHIKIGANGKQGTKYYWTSNPPGFSSSLADPVVAPSNNTVYNLAVADTLTGCVNQNSSNIVVSILKAPAVDPGPNVAVCAGVSASIGTSAIPGDSYSWTSAPPGYVSSAAVNTVTPKQTTSYSLTVTSAQGCTNFDSVTITVNPRPVPVTGAPQNICTGTVIQLGQLADSGHIYSWASQPSGFVSALADPVDSPKISTEYLLKETIAFTGCSDSDSVRISVAPRPDVGFAVKDIDGYGYGFTLNKPNYPGWLYHWDFGDTASGIHDTASGYVVGHTYIQNGRYLVTLTVSLPAFCTVADTYTVVINEAFAFNVFPNPYGLQANINYTLTSPAHVRISMLDEIGRQLGLLMDAHLDRGQYNTILDGATLKLRPAMYIIVFQVDDKVYVREVLQMDSIYY